MKKIDYISLFISIIINFLILFCIPGLKLETLMNQKIKVGLVSFDNDKKIKIDSSKSANTNTKDKNLSATNTNTSTTEKDNEKSSSSTAIDLNKLSEEISMPEVNILSSDFAHSGESRLSHDFKKSKVMTNEIKAFDEKREVEIEPVKNSLNREVKDKNENFQIDSIGEKVEFNSEIGTDIVFDRILEREDGVEGLPSGYKLGTEDGSIVARWDNSNKEPIYPEKAQLRGMHGTVTIKMSIDEKGNILTFILEKGSGVPEINQAIEEVGRTWKIYLSRYGQNVMGDVILEYNFTLKGQE
ncbi:energy transducer TonB [Fusobacterium sp. PH5-44]|uniref:energy transducer TonB n=1 Tax=unclassified Fusobacterium TaxID=2648384 RepID=UPI003D2477C9